MLVSLPLQRAKIPLHNILKADPTPNLIPYNKSVPKTLDQSLLYLFLLPCHYIIIGARSCQLLLKVRSVGVRSVYYEPKLFYDIRNHVVISRNQ